MEFYQIFFDGADNPKLLVCEVGEFVVALNKLNKIHPMPVIGFSRMTGEILFSQKPTDEDEIKYNEYRIQFIDRNGECKEVFVITTDMISALNLVGTDKNIVFGDLHNGDLELITLPK